VPPGHGFPATVSKNCHGVALGGDYQRLKEAGVEPSGKAYLERRDELIGLNVQ
jgi:hypothetical protein